MDFRINDVASARRKICTWWPASASTSPWAKGNAALVGSSGPQALFIMIFSDFFDSSALVPHARKGNVDSWAKNVRRAIVFLLVGIRLLGWCLKSTPPCLSFSLALNEERSESPHLWVKPRSFFSRLGGVCSTALSANQSYSEVTARNVFEAGCPAPQPQPRLTLLSQSDPRSAFRLTFAFFSPKLMAPSLPSRTKKGRRPIGGFTWP